MFRLILLLSLLSNLELYSQSCLAGIHVFNRQGQIDSFPILYPGCTDIAGDFSVSTPNIKNLNGLSQLKSVSGTLRINATDLTTLSGLTNLDTIFQLFISSNTKLQNLNGSDFVGVTRLGLSENPVLTDVSAIRNMTSLKSLASSYNPGLTLIDLQQSTHFENLELVGNNNLTRVDGPEDNTRMIYFRLLGNPLLSTINGFRNVRTLAYCEIKNTPLVNLDPLQGLDSIYGDLILEQDFQLKDISALSGLRYIKRYLSIESTKINSLSGFDSLNYVGNGFSLTSYDILSLAGLESLKKVGGVLEIKVPNLHNLEGLNNLRVCGYLLLSGLSYLESLDGLESLDTVYYLVDISNNPALVNAGSIPHLNYIGGDLRLHHNESLTSLPMFDNLNTINGTLLITNNASLQSLSAFQNLNYIHGGLNVSGNNLLPSLEGLDNIHWYSFYNLVLKNNPSLMICVTPSICQYLAREQPSVISNNASGCQSAQEIIDLCGPLSTNESAEDRISLFPNPTSSSIYLMGENDIQNIILYNAAGNPLMKFNMPVYEIDMSSYPPGIYFISIQMDSGMLMKRVVKI